MERKAAEAERASIKYKQAEFLSDKIGMVFSGVISGVSKWGIYVLIDENKCEGLVPIRTLSDDFYYIDEDNYQVIGRHYGKTYRLGDKIDIKVERVDMMKKQMDFLLAEDKNGIKIEENGLRKQKSKPKQEDKRNKTPRKRNKK